MKAKTKAKKKAAKAKKPATKKVILGRPVLLSGGAWNAIKKAKAKPKFPKWSKLPLRRNPPGPTSCNTDMDDAMEGKITVKPPRKQKPKPKPPTK